MFAQEKADYIEALPDGNFRLIKNATEAPPAIKGILIKEGHFIKNWKERLFIVENGILSYYKLKDLKNPNDKIIKGSFSLRGYFIQKTSGAEMYLWPSRYIPEGKDLRLHTPDSTELNKFPMKVWVAAIRAHIRYAHQTYTLKCNWFPFYQNVMQIPTVDYNRRKIFQVVRRDGANIENELEDQTAFKSFFRYHEIVEIREIVLNVNNTCRGKLSNGDGWVTISTCEGSVVLLELLPAVNPDASNSIPHAITYPDGPTVQDVEEHMIMQDSQISMAPSVFSPSEIGFPKFN